MQSSSLLSAERGRVAVQRVEQLARSCGLHLVSILQFLNPLRLLVLQTSHFRLYRQPLVVLVVDLADQLSPNLLLLGGLFVVADCALLLLLLAHQVLDGHVLLLFKRLLHLDHLFVLGAFLLQPLGLDVVSGALQVHLLHDGALLLLGKLIVAVAESTFLVFALHGHHLLL